MGPTARIFLKEPSSDDLAVRIDAVLRSYDTDAVSGRKGRTWELSFTGKAESPATIHVSLIRTEDRLWDVEDSLDELDLDYESAPSYINLAADGNRSLDWEALEILLRDLSGTLNGIPTAPEE